MSSTDFTQKHQTLPDQTGSANISPLKSIQEFAPAILMSPSGQRSVSIHSLFIINDWSIHISALDGSVFSHMDTGVHGHPP